MSRVINASGGARARAGAEVVEVEVGKAGRWRVPEPYDEGPPQNWSVLAWVCVVLCWPLGLLAREYSRASTAAAGRGQHTRSRQLNRRALLACAGAGLGACAWVLVGAVVLGSVVGHASAPQEVGVTGVVDEAPRGIYT